MTTGRLTGDRLVNKYGIRNMLTYNGLLIGSAIASVSIVGYFGFLIVPPLIGSVAELAGLRWAFGLMALFGAAITLLVQRLIPAGTGTVNRTPDPGVPLADPEVPVAEY